jgi:hypothetical protein
LVREFLLSFDEVTQEILDCHLSPDAQHPETMADLYRRLLISAQNRGMGPGVIGSAIGGVDSLRGLLCEFSPTDVIEKYGSEDWEMLLDDIVAHLEPKGKVRRTSRSLWPQYCQAILTGAAFLSQFTSAEEFHEWVGLFDSDDRIRPALPMLLSYEIHGFGFPLACDFLKEIGYTGFGKPDTHLKRIFEGLQISRSREDYDVFKAILRIAAHADKTPYEVDKLFWLVGSGNFYRSDLKIGRHGEDFIAYTLSRL